MASKYNIILNILRQSHLKIYPLRYNLSYRPLSHSEGQDVQFN